MVTFLIINVKTILFSGAITKPRETQSEREFSHGKGLSRAFASFEAKSAQAAPSHTVGEVIVKIAAGIQIIYLFAKKSRLNNRSRSRGVTFYGHSSDFS